MQTRRKVALVALVQEEQGTFRGVTAMQCVDPPPQRDKPHMQTLADGTEVNWYAACSEWTDHYCMGHPLDSNDRVEAANVAEEG